MKIVPLTACLALSAFGDILPSAHAWEMQTRAKLEPMAKQLEQTLKPWPVPDRTFEVETYGAVGDGTTLNAAAIQRGIDACSRIREDGGNRRRWINSSGVRFMLRPT